MRRSGPRPLATALASLTGEATPPTLLARVQGVWANAVGPAIAKEAQPAAERDGTVTIACRSATWASELELLAPELLDKLNRSLGAAGEAPLKALRAKVAELP